MLDGGTTSLRKSRGLRALGLFVAVWLNLALAPCSMALPAMEQHGCPDCPPAEMTSHHGMHGGEADQTPCADDLDDCMIDDDVSLDGRAGQLKNGDAQDSGVALPAVDTGSLDPQTCPIALTRYAVSRPGAPPPIHLLNCVFLD